MNSKLPWKQSEMSPEMIYVEPQEDGVFNAVCKVYGSSGSAEEMDRPETVEANARLIVLAVNNHERLVKALRKVMEMFVDTTKYPDPETIVTAIRIWFPEARALLAEIEKEEQG